MKVHAERKNGSKGLLKMDFFLMLRIFSQKMIQKFNLKTINSQSKKQIEEEVERWPDRIPDVRYPEKVERRRTEFRM